MKRFFSSILLILLLAGCSGNSVSSLSFSDNSSVNISESSESSDILSSEDDSSSISSSSNDGSSSSSSDSSSISSSSSSSVSSSSSETEIDLGLRSISWVRDYIKTAPITVNSHDIGVNMLEKVTIKGLALDRRDLVKTKSSFGLNISSPKKVLLGDSSGLIYCAGDALFEKVASYAGKDTSRYQVTGYLSIYLGQPELYVPDKSYFIYDSSLDVSSDVTSLINEEKTINDVYDCFTNINYNCAGHGYGGFYVLKGLTCFYTDSNTYYFTDGEHVVKGVKVTSSCSVGGVYDLYGVLSLQNYSPAIIVLKAKNNSSASKKEITASNVSLTLGSVELRKKKNSQDDTDNRYPEFIQMFKNPYKSGPVYMGLCVENSKYYVTYRDTYLDSIVDGKTNAGANYGSIFVDNNNFWNVSSSDLSYNPYADYLLEDNTVTNLYYIPQQLTYSSGKTIWKVLLLPISINI